MKPAPKKIILGITSSESLRLMTGLPEFLASRGWEVVVVTSWGNAEQPISSSSIRYVDINMSRNPTPVKDLIALFRWIAVISREKPKVVFCGTPKAGMLGIIAAWLCRTPTRIYHLRGLRLETASGIAKQIFSFVEKTVITLSSVTLCVSPSLKRAVVSEGLGSESKLVVLGKGSSNGIDITEFVATEELKKTASEFSKQIGLREDIPTIGFVGRLTTDKGVFDLIAAHKTLLEQNMANQLLLIGNPENETEANKIKNEVKGIPSIFTPGLMRKPQIAFRLINIFCLPSYREGFPNVVLEAGLSKLPTVTTTATGACDSVVPGKTGIIYETGDITGLVEGLSTLIQNPRLANELGDNAFEFVSAEFNRLVVWEKIETFLTNMLPAKQTRGL